MELLQALEGYSGARTVRGGGHPASSQNLHNGIAVTEAFTTAERDLDEVNAVHVYDGEVAFAGARMRAAVPVVAKLNDETATTKRMRMKGSCSCVPALQKC